MPFQHSTPQCSNPTALLSTPSAAMPIAPNRRQPLLQCQRRQGTPTGRLQAPHAAQCTWCGSNRGTHRSWSAVRFTIASAPCCSDVFGSPQNTQEDQSGLNGLAEHKLLLYFANVHTISPHTTARFPARWSRCTTSPLKSCTANTCFGSPLCNESEMLASCIWTILPCATRERLRPY